jgi:hypothetical protein
MDGLSCFGDRSGTNSSGYQACPKCGKPYYTLYPSTTAGGTCSCKSSFKPPTGWICPACGCGNAPWSSKCNHCVPEFKGSTRSTKGLGPGGQWLRQGSE